jgi:hypothetical protein
MLSQAMLLSCADWLLKLIWLGVFDQVAEVCTQNLHLAGEETGRVGRGPGDVTGSLLDVESGLDEPMSCPWALLEPCSRSRS